MNRNFVVYDTIDMVVRFAMSNKVGVRTGTDFTILASLKCLLFCNSEKRMIEKLMKEKSMTEKLMTEKLTTEKLMTSIINRK